MSCTLEERLALILLELSENFGLKDKRGTRLSITPRHKDLADLVSASRPRVTEFLIQFERDNMIIRDQRHLIIRREACWRISSARPIPTITVAKLPIYACISIAHCAFDSRCPNMRCLLIVLQLFLPGLYTKR